MFKVIKKADIILFAALVLMGAALSVPAFLYDSPGDTVKITLRGKLYGTYRLDEDREIRITDKAGTNTVKIENGTVKMESASCKNQICVHTGRITKAGQSIVCLPNRVAVTIEGYNDEFDAVSGK